MPGVTTYGLGVLLPDGGELYVALFTTPPAPNGSGGVEVSAAGYGRPKQEGWTTTEQDDGSWTRANNSAIEFASFELPLSAGRIEAVGIYDAFTNGNLIVWSRCEQIEDLQAGDQVRFVTGSISFGSTP